MSKVYIEKSSHKEKGKVYPEEQAKVSVFDVGFQRGIGIFETLRTYNGKFFKIDDHLSRLLESAQSLGLEHPWSKSELKERMITTLNKTELDEASSRIIITGGEDQGLMEPEDPVLIITIKELHEYPDEFYQEGVKAITVDGKRSFPDAKTLDYLTGFRAVKKARDEDAHEAIYTDQGKALEGTTSNIFAVKDNIIVTPAEGILPGITRSFVIEIAKDYRVEERNLPLSALYGSDEVFLTSTHREILPVTQVDEHEISEEPGSVTKELMKKFEEQIQSS
ncbi:MAG: aminotransferase class IV [Candidatus Paceibacterota bacterium]